MIWVVSFFVLLLFWKMPFIKRWYQEKIHQRMCSWVVEHKDELPIEPSVINAGEWVKIEGNAIVSKDGIYLFIVKGG